MCVCRHGVPVTDYFPLVDSPYVAVMHVMQTWLAVGFAIYPFIRHPTIFTCSSPHECECLHLPQIGPWYEDLCSMAGTNSTLTHIDGDGAGDALGNVTNHVHIMSNGPLATRVDPLGTIDWQGALLAMLCSLAGGAVLWLSVLYARTRKRMLKVHQLEGELMSADAELLEAQMSSQVREKNSLLITFPNLGRKSHRLHSKSRLLHSPKLPRTCNAHAPTRVVPAT